MKKSIQEDIIEEYKRMYFLKFIPIILVYTILLMTVLLYHLFTITTFRII